MIETLNSIANAAGLEGWNARGFDDPSAGAGNSLENPRTSWDRIFEVQESYAGKAVTEISALQLAAVWRCVWLISGAIARTPFLPYQRGDEGKVLARGHYLWPVLNLQANPLMTAYRWKRLMQAWICLWGNAYSFIEENGRGQVVALWPLRPDKMTPKVLWGRNGELSGMIYEYVTNSGQLVKFNSFEILHLRGLESDGVRGLSPIRAARQSLGLAIAAEEYGARYFGQGVHVGGWISHPATLSPTAKKNIRETIGDVHSGLHGSHKLAVLEEGMQYHEVGIPPEDMQFLQTRQFQAIDIARLFGVPPHKIAELSRATFSNIEHQGIDFVRDCLADWFANWKNECSCALLSTRESQSLELDFYTADLLKGDLLSRYQAYAIGRNGGWLSPNMILEREGENRIDEPWADDFLQPLNMVVAGEDEPPSEDPEVVEPGDEDEEEPEPPVGTAPGAMPQKMPMPPGVAAPTKTKKPAKKLRYRLVAEEV